MLKKKVLLVGNDINDNSHHMCRVFLDSGCHVNTADNGRLAYDEILKNHYDLVISDLDLSKINGFSLLKQIKNINSSLPVILVSSAAEVKDAVSAMKMGADDFLMKPLTPKIIQILVSNISNGKHKKSKTEYKKRFEIITQNKEMKRLLAMAQDIADSKASIFIQGESGTGKELFARYIHSSSTRKDKAFVAVNCSALPETLLESELFGHEKGAFTGAVTKKKGRFELAEKGTLLLDEISEMDYQLQSKLLRVLQEREIDRIGGISPIPIDVRFIATTNRDIGQMIKENKFREDLHYRLNVIPFYLPPLRERRDDILLLSKYFIKKYSELNHRTVHGLTESAETHLMQMIWKGNIRELENVMERAVLMCKGDLIDQKDLLIGDKNRDSENVPPLFQPNVSLKEIEKNVILNALQHTDGNRTHAAEILGISVRTLRNKLNEYRKKMEIQ